MKICVVGAGAIGGLLGVRLGLSGHDVSLILRGANLAAVREHGLRLIAEDGAESLLRPARVTERLAEAGPQDMVILGMKAHQVAAVAPDLHALLHDGTRIVTMQNGVPWWYFHGLDGPHAGHTLESVDPGGLIARHIEARRVIGSVVYAASEIVRPGVIRLIEGNRFTLGEPDGSDSETLRAIATAFRGAGFKAPATRDIRGEIWLKLWGNLCFNPISALTHATLEDICLHAGARDVAAAMMREGQQVAEKLGVSFKVSLEQRIAGAQAVGAHKTSMLQDVEHGRPMELQALVASVMELGRLTGVPTPTIDSVFGLCGLLAQSLARQRGALRVQALA